MLADLFGWHYMVDLYVAVIVLIGARQKSNVLSLYCWVAAEGLRHISNHLVSLGFEATPDYAYLRSCLETMPNAVTYLSNHVAVTAAYADVPALNDGYGYAQYARDGDQAYGSSMVQMSAQAPAVAIDLQHASPAAWASGTNGSGWYAQEHSAAQASQHGNGYNHRGDNHQQQHHQQQQQQQLKEQQQQYQQQQRQQQFQPHYNQEELPYHQQDPARQHSYAPSSSGQASKPPRAPLVVEYSTGPASSYPPPPQQMQQQQWVHGADQQQRQIQVGHMQRGPRPMSRQQSCSNPASPHTANGSHLPPAGLEAAGWGNVAATAYGKLC